MTDPTLCVRCGNPVRVTKTKGGNKVALDVRAPIYEVKRDFLGDEYIELARHHAVPHVYVCMTTTGTGITGDSDSG